MLRTQRNVYNIHVSSLFEYNVLAKTQVKIKNGYRLLTVLTYGDFIVLPYWETRLSDLVASAMVMGQPFGVDEGVERQSPSVQNLNLVGSNPGRVKSITLKLILATF